MRIAIDILHPAHVHFFKHFYWEMMRHDHEFLITAREKDCTTNLLERLNIPHTVISTAAKSRLPQGIEFFHRTRIFLRLARRFKPDVLTGIMGPTIAVAGRLLRRPVYIFYDTECSTLTNRFAYPLATRVITPDCYQAKIGKHHLRYPGYHELAYLNQNRFVPDERVVRQYGLDPLQRYCVVRFVGWWATHDRGERGLTAEQKRELVRRLERFGRVVISSEGDVPTDLQDKLFRGSIEQFHHLLAFADLYLGESATMASEAAVLGTPAIYVAKTSRGYIDHQAQYGMVRVFTDQQFADAVTFAEDALQGSNTFLSQAKDNRASMLDGRIDVTEFMIDLFEQDFGNKRTTTRSTDTTVVG